jgi:hypothetical protein
MRASFLLHPVNADRVPQFDPRSTFAAPLRDYLLPAEEQCLGENASLRSQ